MKKLLLIILLFPLFTYAQQTFVFDTKDSKVGVPIQGKLTTVQPTKKYTLTSGEYLTQAGTCYLFGTGLSLLGSAIAFSNISTENSDNTRIIAGGAVAVGGLIFTVIAHIKLIKAGNTLIEERKISFHPSSSGIGLAMKF